MQWQWAFAAVAVLLVIRMVWFSITEARARRSLRYINAATSVMKEVDHFTKQFFRLGELDNAQIAVASLRLPELSHMVRSWIPPKRNQEMHRHLIHIVRCAADEWEGAPHISPEEANARIDRTHAAIREFQKTQGWKNGQASPRRRNRYQTKISAFFFGYRH